MIQGVVNKIYHFLGDGYKWVRQSLGEKKKRRYGHAACVWEEQIIIVGGARMFNKDTKQRPCMGDVLLLNPYLAEWNEIPCEGLQLEPRHYHSSVVVGNQLLIYGGLNGQLTYLSDLLSLYLTKVHDPERQSRWIQIYPKGPKPGPLAYHTCHLVIHPDRYRSPGQISLFTLPDLRLGRPKVEYEGVYFFGGRDEKGPKNRLIILRIGQKQIYWDEPSLEGQQPIARYGHSMNYYPEKNIMILFGGRNDDNYVNTGQSYLNDIWVLFLDKLCWQQWDKEDQGSMPIARYSHCSANLGTAIIVFGGLSDENYCKSDVYCLETEASVRLKYEKTLPKYETEMQMYSPANESPDLKQPPFEEKNIYSEEQFPVETVQEPNPEEENLPLVVEDLIDEEIEQNH